MSGLTPPLAILLLTVTLAGCVLHMDSAVPASAATFDDRLPGTWVTGQLRAVITRRGAAEYDILYTEPSDTVSFRGALGEIGGHTVLEVRPVAADLVDGWPTAGMLVFVSIDRDSATMRIIDTDSLRAALARDGQGAFFEQEGNLVLTGDRGAMNAILRVHLGTPGMLEPGQVWRRLRR